MQRMIFVNLPVKDLERSKAFYEDHVLLDQKYVRDDSKTIQQLLDEVGAKVGENVTVRRFARFRLGEEE